MATAAESPFDQLKSCSQDTRRKVFQQLWRDGQIKRNGFTVYQYHVVPAILEEQRILTPSAVSVHHAEIRAGLRWSYTDQEQENFWRLQTQILLSGNIAPLQPSTFADYVQGRYNAIFESALESPVAAIPIQQSELDPESASSKSGANVQTTPAHSPPEISERESNDESISASADEGTAPTSTSPTRQSSPMSALELTQDDGESSTSKPGAVATRPVCLAETAPSYAEIASSKPTDILSSDPAKPTNPPIAFPVHKLRCDATSTPSKLRAPAPSAVQRLVEDLGPLEQGHRKLWGGCKRLDAMIQESGFTLFEHHISALARRGCEAALEANNEPGRFASIWRTMPWHEEVQWRADTASLKTGLQKGQKGVLIHFDTEVPNKRQRRYRTQVLTASHAYLRGKCSAPIQLDRTSIVDVLLGTSPKGIETEVVIHAIHRSIVHRGLLESGLHLWFRYRGTSFSYDDRSPGEDDGMKRLSNVAWRGLTPDDAATDCQDRIMAMNAILKPLVYLNRDNSAFADMENIDFEDEEILGCNLDTYKSLHWAQEVIKRRWPLKPAHKELIVEAIMNKLRSRRPYFDPGVDLRSEEWSIETNTSGLAAKLLRCFDREGLGSRAYEDLMEQIMWAFFQVDPALADKIDPSGQKYRERAVLLQYRGKCG